MTTEYVVKVKSAILCLFCAKKSTHACNSHFVNIHGKGYSFIVAFERIKFIAVCCNTLLWRCLCLPVMLAISWDKLWVRTLSSSVHFNGVVYNEHATISSRSSWNVSIHCRNRTESSWKFLFNVWIGLDPLGYCNINQEIVVSWLFQEARGVRLDSCVHWTDMAWETRKT